MLYNKLNNQKRKERFMKKLFLVFALIAILCISAAADLKQLDSDFVKEGDFIIASVNSTKNYITGSKNTDAIDDLCYWLSDYDEVYNIKFVSFFGQIASKSTYTYANTVVEKGMTKEELNNLCASDNTWKKEFQALAKSLEILTDDNVAVGVGFSLHDLFSDGYFRDSFQSEVFPVEDLQPDDAPYTAHNDENYYTVIENNGVKYLIAQLETYPREETLNWFNGVLENNPDKRVIILTHSFLDADGQMYTQWDWANGFSFEGTSALKGYNITNIGKPRDGERLWEYSFSKYDNILAIISANNIKDSNIKTLKLTNANGVDVAAVVANPSNNGFDVSHDSLILMTKISADNTEISFFYYSPYKGYLTDSVQTIKLDKLGELADPIEVFELPTIDTQYNGANTSYILGYEENTFRPNANMTRAEACTIFARLLLGVNDIPDGYTTRFTDVEEGTWYYNAIAYLDQSGFFQRNTSTEYKPNEPITRAEFVELANLASSITGSSTISFTDVPEDHFYYDSIVAAAASGLVNGYEDNTFRPDNTITRAEVVTVINRLLGLNVSERTVSTTQYNIFSDCTEHWALYNIIMASNDNVHGDYYFDASLDGVKVTSSTVEIANKHFMIEVNKKTGKVTKILNLATNENVLNTSVSSELIYVTSPNETKSLPSNFEVDGNRLKVTFKNKEVVYLIVDVNDNFISFEIDSELSSKSASVTFANFNTTLDPTDENNDYRIGSMAMAAYVKIANYGYGNYKNTSASAFSRFDAGTVGAKVGIVLSSDDDYLEYMKEVALAIDKTIGLVNTTAGPWAQEYQKNYEDYVMIDRFEEGTVDYLISKKDEYGYGLVDILRGDKSFKQGDFSFPIVSSGTAEQYYEEIGYKFDEAGLDTALHCYAYYIQYNSTDILSNPKWQKQLEYMSDTYTLRKDISAVRVNIPTVEDASGFDLTVSFFYKNSRYILIDEEIIYITQAGTSSGFIGTRRGQCGTTATTHKAGTTIYHLSGYFNEFVPVIGSELFYHIADRIADAYNKGGFDMIYFDAIDGLNRHVDQQDVWYYWQMFIHRVVSQCEKDPIVEDSSNSGTQVWNVRARQGAWDTANRSYKKFIANHVEINLSLEQYGFVTMLGWFNFYPDMGNDLKNTITKTLFHDDMDYLGVQTIVHNMTSVVSGFREVNIESNPYYVDNLKYFNEYYTKLRNSNYFTDEAKQKVIDIGGEWKVIEKSDGEYAFLQMSYSKTNINNTRDELLNTFTVNNPFSAQTPFVRIESRYSTEFTDPIVLCEFDETKTLAEQKLTGISLNHINLTNNMATTIRVKGTGRDGDAALISLTGGVVTGESNGRTDYFIDLNFTGWREIVLLDLDNGEYDTDKYKFDNIVTTGSGYATYRVVTSFADIVQVTVRLCGDTASSAQFGDLIAYAHNDAAVKNPTVKVGNSTMTFNCEIKGGEYLEYDPLTNKAILYHADEQTTEEITFTGTLSVPSGNSSAEYTATALTDAPVRAKVVLGFSGVEVTN